jgi:G3E family GTPase
MASIPLQLVNGFLGSGKTTFLLHYLDTFSRERKIAVIQNEFSSSGIDGEIIRHHYGTYSMMEINNGSVFCVCLLGSFIDSLAAFIQDNSPDEIIMEASGMSDPVSIGQIFQSPKLKDKVYLGYSWTIVDARNFNRIISIRSRLEHQVRIADTVIINKCDLAANESDSVVKAVKKINPFASIISTSYAKIDFEEKKNPLKFFPAADNTDSHKPNLQSVVIKSNCTISKLNLKNFIDTVKGDFIRCKGFVNTGKNQKIMIQGSFEDYTFEEVGWFAGGTELVGIGSFSETKNYTEIFETFCNS